MRVTTVFLSSTSRDLGDLRLQVRDALLGLDGIRAVHMGDFGARPETPDQVSRAGVADCDVYIGIIGHLYGSCPPGEEQSFTEREFNEATRLAKPRLMFLAGRTARPKVRESESDRRKQRAFRARVRRELTLSEFNKRSDLVGDVLQAFRNWEHKRARPALSFDSLFEKFRTRYLEMVFGGRRDILGRLTAWLQSPSTPPYLLLASEAGLGKSAIVVHWFESVRRDANTIFVPVSIQDRTNSAAVALASLARSLSALQGLQPRAEPSASIEERVQEIHDLLTRDLAHGERALVIVDGLDEASNWEDNRRFLFPRRPGTGIKVLLSARLYGNHGTPKHWIDELGIEGQVLPVKLPPLDRTGIGEVLHLRDILTNAAITDRLEELTRGDPLLLKLYLDEMRDRGDFSLGFLEGFKPGYGGFFNDWLDRQLELRGIAQPDETMFTVAGVIATAHAPLGLAEIFELAAIAAGAASFNVRRAAEIFDRLLVGDARNGFTFVHDRLRQHFLDEFLGTARADLARRHFAAWGADRLNRLRQGKLAPKEISEYLIAHYSEHLKDAGAVPERFAELLSPEWLGVARRLDVGLSTFLLDAQRAIEAAFHARPVDIAILIRGLLCQIGVLSPGANLNAEELRRRVEQNEASIVWALVVARQKRAAPDRALCLARLASLAGSERDSILDEALEAAGDHFDTLLAILPCLQDRQLHLIRSRARYSGIVGHLTLLIGVARHMVAPEDRREALAAARRGIEALQNSRQRARLLVEWAELATREDCVQALPEVNALLAELKRADAMDIYPRLLKLLDEPQRTAMLVTARKLARKSSDAVRLRFEAEVLPILAPPYRPVVIRRLITLAKRFEQVDLVTKQLEAAGEDPPSQWALPGASPAIPRTQQPPDPVSLQRNFYAALIACARTGSVEARKAAGVALIEDPLSATLLSGALDVLRAVPQNRLNPLFAWAGDDLAKQALLFPLLPEHLRPGILERLADYLRDHVLPPEVLSELVGSLAAVPPALRSTLLDPILPDGLAQLRAAWVVCDASGQATAAFVKAIREIPDIKRRLDHLLRIACHLPPEKRPRILGDAFVRARRIRDAATRAAIFCALSDCLEEPLAAEAIRRALLIWEGLAPGSAAHAGLALQLWFRLEDAFPEQHRREALGGMRAVSDFVADAQLWRRPHYDRSLVSAIWNLARSRHPSQDLHDYWWTDIHEPRRTYPRPGQPVFVSVPERLARMISVAPFLGGDYEPGARRLIESTLEHKPSELPGERMVEMASKFPAEALLEICPEAISEAAILDILRSASRRTQHEFYRLLGALAPLLARYWGEAAMTSITFTLLETRNWWTRPSSSP
jgi:hypothetical protein